MLSDLMFFIIIRLPPGSTRTDPLCPYTTLLRSGAACFSHVTGRAYTKPVFSAQQSNSCLNRLNHGFCCNAEFLEEFLGRGGGAEAAHADEGAARLDPAVPAEAGRRLAGDVQRAGPEHLVAVVDRKSTRLNSSH